MCSPGLSLDDYFATAAEWERPIFEAVSSHLMSLGDVIIDPLAMGIMFKNGPMLCQLRAMKKWTALGFSLRRRLASDRLSRKVVDYKGKYFHVINVNDASMIDDEVLGWLTEAYHVAGGTEPPPVDEAGADGADPMVPNDIDDIFGH